MMIAHQAIDWTEAAGQFEGIDQIGFTGNKDLYDIVVHEFGCYAKRETRGAVAHEIKKASLSKPSVKDQSGCFNH
jgi:hypothetical protein